MLFFLRTNDKQAKTREPRLPLCLGAAHTSLPSSSASPAPFSASSACRPYGLLHWLPPPRQQTQQNPCILTGTPEGPASCSPDPRTAVRRFCPRRPPSPLARRLCLWPSRVLPDAPSREAALSAGHRHPSRPDSPTLRLLFRGNTAQSQGFTSYQTPSKHRPPAQEALEL